MEKRYRALRIISTLYKVFGAIVLVIAVLAAIATCLMSVLGGSLFTSMMSQDMPSGYAGLGFMSSALTGVIIGFISLIGGGFSGLSMFAMGEGISLAIAIEENTRATAVSLVAHTPAPAVVYTPPVQ